MNFETACYSLVYLTSLYYAFVEHRDLHATLGFAMISASILIQNRINKKP